MPTYLSMMSAYLPVCESLPIYDETLPVHEEPYLSMMRAYLPFYDKCLPVYEESLPVHEEPYLSDESLPTRL